MTSVFIKVLDKPLFKKYFKYCREEQSREDKLCAYAEFVSEIYAGGISFTDLVCKYLFEDENIYIRSVAHKIEVSDSVKTAVKHEISVFERFSSLSTSDFAKDLGVEYVSPFESYKTDVWARFNDRLVAVNKLGYGIFSSSVMFRLSDDCEIEPIASADKTTMDKFVGYEEERLRVVNNTKAFIEGRPAANVLLCGDAGTGKSSTVKAIANNYFAEGIRLIELRKDQLRYLPYVMGKISENPLKFIIFIDDLSFNRSDDNFSMLKATLEGSASAKAKNAVIYATSNRRHIIKESFDDRGGTDVHINDTLQESLSLSERFGLVVLFQKPSKQLYLDIVHTLVYRNGINMDPRELDIKAEAFALRKGSRSARCAEQFVESLM